MPFRRNIRPGRYMQYVPLKCWRRAKYYTALQPTPRSLAILTQPGNFQSHIDRKSVARMTLIICCIIFTSLNQHVYEVKTVYQQHKQDNEQTIRMPVYFWVSCARGRLWCFPSLDPDLSTKIRLTAWWRTVVWSQHWNNFRDKEFTHITKHIFITVRNNFS
jgi:hypothetical protein